MSLNIKYLFVIETFVSLHENFVRIFRVVLLFSYQGSLFFYSDAFALFVWRLSNITHSELFVNNYLFIILSEYFALFFMSGCIEYHLYIQLSTIILVYFQFFSVFFSLYDLIITRQIWPLAQLILNYLSLNPHIINILHYKQSFAISINLRDFKKHPALCRVLS